MKLGRRLSFTACGLLIFAGVLGYLVLTGERGLSRAESSFPARALDVERLGAAETEGLGWDPAGLDAVFAHTATLSSDVLMIVTEGRVVGAFGDTAKRYPVHSIRKALLSALVGQHIGAGPRQIPLDGTLEALGIDDAPTALTPLQRQATVLHLIKNLSGINRPAAAEAGLTAEKARRLGDRENQPGTVWAYNNWDHNALTTVFETRTGLSVAEAFGSGFAEPLGLRDHTAEAVTYGQEPKLSQHRAASFRMSGRDLARFGALYLNQGVIDGRRLLPADWIARITTDFTETGETGLTRGHGYLWWVPGPETGLPAGSFWAFGLGHQGLFVIPEWRTVVVHQADMTAFLKRFFQLIEDEGLPAEAALEQLALSCLEPDQRQSAFCVEHRFVLRREFNALISLIAAARR